MNLVEIYHNYMYPASKVEEGMELIITNCKSYFVKDGTIGKVILAGEKCEDITEGCIKSKCCQHNIITGDDVFSHLDSCVCTFHTLDGKLVVSDKEYYERRRIV